MESLALKTFLIVGVMLSITAISARINKAFETKWEFWGLFLGIIALIFIIPMTSFPINLVLTLVFAGLMGLLIGPSIKGMMVSFVVRQNLKKQGYDKKKLKTVSSEEQQRLITQSEKEVMEGLHPSFVADWNKVLGLAIFSTAGITIAAAFVVFAFDFNFSFLGQALFVALLGLIVVGLLNIFFFKSTFVRLACAYVGAVIFSLYLLYDFDRLKASAGDASWETAISISISIYLDIVNLFLSLLDILSSN